MSDVAVSPQSIAEIFGPTDGGHRALGKFLPACPPESRDLYAAIWTELRK